MQKRFVVHGTNRQEEAVMLAYELLEADFKIQLHLVPLKDMAANAVKQLEKNWLQGETVEFPDGSAVIEPDLNADSILPEDIKTEETGKLRERQNEWAYHLLTNKLWESYILELEELKQRCAALTGYDRKLFDDAKSFWERVLEQRKARDLSQERLDNIKQEVNGVFEQLKYFRKAESEQFDQNSSSLREQFEQRLATIREKLNNHPKYKELSEELKALQAESRQYKLTRNDETTLRKAFDAAFQAISEHRSHYFSNRNSSRIEGLTAVIRKMEHSLQRDKNDLEYNLRRINAKGAKPMEVQLLKLKMKMLEEAVSSKELKLKDIYATLEKLQRNQAAKAATPENKNGSNETDEATEALNREADAIVNAVNAEEQTTDGKQPA